MTLEELVTVIDFPVHNEPRRFSSGVFLKFFETDDSINAFFLHIDLLHGLRCFRWFSIVPLAPIAVG